MKGCRAKKTNEEKHWRENEEPKKNSKEEMKSWRRAERNYGKQRTADPRRKLTIEIMSFLKTSSLVTVNSIKHGRTTERNPSHPVVGGGPGLQRHHRRHIAPHHHINHINPTRTKTANHDPRIDTKTNIGNRKMMLLGRGQIKTDNSLAKEGSSETPADGRT